MNSSIILALLASASVGAIIIWSNDTGTVNRTNLGDGGSPTTPRGVIEKTIFSSKLRLAFWVGLEGSGHHVMVGTIDQAFSTKAGRYGGHGCTIKAENYYLTTAMKGNPENYVKAVNDARADLQQIARSELSALLTGTVATLCGRWSYPNGMGPEKVMQYLDVGLMAELAEAEGVDLRIIYLKRSAFDIFLSTTVHRKLHRELEPNTAKRTEAATFMRYARILYTDAAVIHSYLAGLDTKFVVCHDMDYVGDSEQASAIADFVAPTRQKAEALRTAFLAVSPAKRATREMLPIADTEAVVYRLQHKLDAFESNYCHGKV